MPRFEVDYCLTIETSAVVEAKNADQAADLIQAKFMDDGIDIDTEEIIMDLHTGSKIVLEITGIGSAELN